MDARTSHGQTSAPRIPWFWLPCALLVALFFTAALPLILSENLLGRAAFDQLHYHEPTIRKFAAELPRPDLSDYRSATTPGYHLLLAAVARYVSGSGVVLQLFGSLLTAGLLGLFAITVSRVGGMRACLLGLPLLASIYVFFPGVWLVPDNFGWLLVAAVGVIGWRIAGKGWSVGRFVAALLLVLAVVLVRQSHLWCAALIWLGGWIGAAPVGDGGILGMLSAFRQRARALLPAAAASAPAILVLLYFRSLWAGMTPPTFAHQYDGIINWATPAFVLSLVAAYSVFFSGFVADSAWRVLREHALLLVMFAVGAVVVATIPETTYVHEERSTGLWNLVRIAPVVGGHTSVVLLVLAPLGAWATLAWFFALGAKERWFFLGTLAAFTLAQTANPLCWQRYMEPLFIMLMGWGAATIIGNGARDPGSAQGMERFIRHSSPFLRVAGPLALTALLSLITARELLNPDVPWNTEIGPDGRRRVAGGVLVIPGVRMEEQEHRRPKPQSPLPEHPAAPAAPDNR